MVYVKIAQVIIHQAKSALLAGLGEQIDRLLEIQFSRIRFVG